MKRLPIVAVLLGLGGLVPFLACTAAILFVPRDVPVPRLVAAEIGYGAVILSFLGAVHWGLALAGDPVGVPLRAEAQRMRLALGVLPALAGWAASLSVIAGYPMAALVLLIAAFLLTAAVEARAGRAGLMPPGYLGLRWLLTTVVVLSLVTTLLARIVL